MNTTSNMSLVVGLLLLLSSSLHAQFTPQSLQAGMPGGVLSNGAMFEIKSLTGVAINDFDVDITALVLGPMTNIELWALNTTGSYLGSQSSNTNWTLLGTAANVPGFHPQPMGLSLNFPIPAGQTQAFYITLAPGAGHALDLFPGVAPGTLYSADSNLEFYEGHHDTGYFSATSTGGVFAGTIHYTPLPAVADDIGLASILSPTNNATDCNALSTTESVTVELRNLGSNAIPVGTGVPITYQVDATGTVLEVATVSSALMPGGTLQFTFATPADFSAVGSHTLNVSAQYALDLDPSNDSLTTLISSGGQLRVASFPYSEDFDLAGGPATTSPPLGFVNETTDSTGPNADWIMRSDATPTNGVGPSADHTTGTPGMGGFAYLEGNGNKSPINLRSPCLDLNALANPTCRFWVHSDSAAGAGTANHLNVDVISYPSGTVTTNVIPTIGHIGSAWTLQAINLSPFIGQVVQMVFRGDTTIAGQMHDIAIDDFSVTDLQPTPGQAPQPGLAVLNLNDPLNVNGDPLSFGFGGPYFTSVVAGDLLVFEVEATPLQFITLIAGPLNPSAATYPGIGSIDLGGPIDPMTGIPTAITVLADGSVPVGLNGFFFTAANGHFEFGITVPNFPPGVQVTFQVAISASAGVSIKLSNAVEVTF